MKSNSSNNNESSFVNNWWKFPIFHFSNFPLFHQISLWQCPSLWVLSFMTYVSYHFSQVQPTGSQFFQRLLLGYIVLCIRRLVSLSSNSFTGILMLWTKIKEFGVRIGNSILLSAYVKGVLFRLISICNYIPLSSVIIRWTLLNDLYSICFVDPIIRLNCPQHHGVLAKLNFHLISFLTR